MTANLPTRRALLAGGSLLLACPALAAQTMLRIGDQKGSAQPLMQAAGVLGGLPYRVEWSQFAGRRC